MYGFIYSECYEKVTMVRVGWVLPVFNRAELRFLFPSWSLYGPGTASDSVPWQALDQVEDPASGTDLGQYGRGREKALRVYLHR